MHEHMIAPIEFFVRGIPKPAGSKRAFVIRKGGQYTGRAVVTDDCKGSKDWKHDVKLAAQDAYSGPPLEAALAITVTFFMPRPKGHWRTGKNANELRESAPQHPLTKPDATKLLRGVEDAITGIVWRDDCQIVTQRVFKTFADGRGPGVQIKIAEVLGGICVKWRAV